MSNIVREAIAEVLASTPLSDPREIAAKVLERLPESDYREALEVVLPSYVVKVFSQARLLTSVPMPVRSGHVGSPMVAMVRNAWATRLATPLLVGDDWKTLGECTALDLKLVAESLRENADKSLMKASYYEQIAAALPAGATVSTLTEDPTS